MVVQNRFCFDHKNYPCRNFGQKPLKIFCFVPGKKLAIIMGLDPALDKSLNIYYCFGAKYKLLLKSTPAFLLPDHLWYLPFSAIQMYMISETLADRCCANCIQVDVLPNLKVKNPQLHAFGDKNIFNKNVAFPCNACM